MEERSFLSTVANFPKASAAAQSSLLKKITKQSASHFNSPELHQHHQASVHNHFRRLRLKIFTLHQLLQSATSVAARKYNATLICQKRVPQRLQEYRNKRRLLPSGKSRDRVREAGDDHTHTASLYVSGLPNS
ncbi:unnamed protein product [Brassica napus]|uniref:(rape) hypothetical protein n=1 Tax=Brassica napus TaxID=3708 RepID=A0A816JBX3_BRANA|nr:unnamed protein product [Brassica napus]